MFVLLPQNHSAGLALHNLQDEGAFEFSVEVVGSIVFVRAAPI